MNGIFSAIAKALGIGAKYQEDKNTPKMKQRLEAERAARRKDAIEKAASEEDTEFFKGGLGE